MSIKKFRLLLKNSIIFNPNIKIIILTNTCLIFSLYKSLYIFFAFFIQAKITFWLTIILFNAWVIYNKIVVKKWDFGKYKFITIDLDKELLKLNDSVKINFEDIKLIDVVEYKEKPLSPLARESFTNTDLIIYLNDKTQYNVNIQFVKILKKLIKTLEKTIIPVSYAGIEEKNITAKIVENAIFILALVFYMANWEKCINFLSMIIHGG